MTRRTLLTTLAVTLLPWRKALPAGDPALSMSLDAFRQAILEPELVAFASIVDGHTFYSIPDWATVTGQSTAAAATTPPATGRSQAKARRFAPGKRGGEKIMGARDSRPSQL